MLELNDKPGGLRPVKLRRDFLGLEVAMHRSARAFRSGRGVNKNHDEGAELEKQLQLHPSCGEVKNQDALYKALTAKICQLP